MCSARFLANSTREKQKDEWTDGVDPKVFFDKLKFYKTNYTLHCSITNILTDVVQQMYGFLVNMPFMNLDIKLRIWFPGPVIAFIYVSHTNICAYFAAQLKRIYSGQCYRLDFRQNSERR